VFCPIKYSHKWVSYLGIERYHYCGQSSNIEHDKLPRRLLKAKLEGSHAGNIIFTEEDFARTVQLFFDLVGCEPDSGRPLKGKLVELGLDWFDALLTR